MGCRIITATVPNPAAGADWSFTPSATDRVKLLAVTAQLVTGATAADRSAALKLSTQNDLDYYSGDFAVTQATGLTVTYSWARGTSGWWSATIADNQRVAAPLPEIWLEPGDKVKTSTDLLAATDQWSQIVFRYITGHEWEELQEYEHLASLLG